MEYHRTPRPHYLHRGTVGRPLIVALHGFTQTVAEPTSWRPWNFVRLSGLLDLAIRAGCSVCFPRGKFRNWGAKDAASIGEVVKLTAKSIGRPETYLFGFSDGATLANYLNCDWSTAFEFDAVVVHSGLWPRGATLSATPGEPFPRTLLVCGADDRTPVARQQDEIKRRYLEAGRTVERWEISGVGHAWAREWNGRMLAWCEGEASF